MSTPKVAFVLIHGGWHNRSAWNKVIPILEAGGHTVLTLDLPGAGANTIAPKSLGARPFDLAAFAAEPSSIAGVALDERTQAVVALVNEAASVSDGKVILVGRSAGGMVISAVAEQVPELLSRFRQLDQRISCVIPCSPCLADGGHGWQVSCDGG